ncbi:MAG: metal ABC transporter ATP-binding protein [Desulfovibrionales bacterium]|nr:MAG: metal ABC transporter ATP-binding protein [Desulfovibrionales bacterium]
MTPPVVDAQDVCFAYDGCFVLEDVHLQVRRGEFLAVMGPNGGGKTTLLKILLGLLVPQRGVVSVLDATPGKASRKVGYVPQQTNIHLQFPITAEDLVLLGRLPHRRRTHGFGPMDREAACQALHRVGMWPFRRRRIGQLSGGQRQRVFIARALANEPELLLLDEPTASVDREFQGALYDLLKTLNARMTIIVVSHDLTVLSSYATSVACVNRRLYYHDRAELTPAMLESTYHCPIELVTHGPVPHRVLKEHDLS